MRRARRRPRTTGQAERSGCSSSGGPERLPHREGRERTRRFVDERSKRERGTGAGDGSRTRDIEPDGFDLEGLSVYAQ